MLEGVDGRTVEGRRYRDLCISFANDMGGADKLSEAERILCRQAAASVVASERFQADILASRSKDLGELARLTAATSELLSGLRTRKRPSP